MNLDWTPTLGAPTFIEIPVTFLTCTEAASREWPEIQRRWHAGREVPPQWRRYIKLGDEGRFRPKKGGQASLGFAEAHAAVYLRRKGFEVWPRVMFFDHGRGNHAEFPKQNTAEVRRLWQQTLKGVPWPSDVEKHMRGPAPKNPDIVAYHPKRNEWLFCEVKGKGDRVMPAQLTGLGVLHLLTAAPVAVVWVLPPSTKVKGGPTMRCVLRYRKHADLDWGLVGAISKNASSTPHREADR